MFIQNVSAKPPPRSTAVLALDVGDVRIGVAISRSGVIAEPLQTVERLGRSQVLDALQRIVEESGATLCVVGLPLLEGGAEGEQAEKTRAFARSMARRFPALKIEWWDERHSSGAARGHAGRRADGDRGLIDRIAAAVILQEYLDDQSEKKRRQQGDSGT